MSEREGEGGRGIVCVRKREIYLDIYIERERDRKGDRERERELERVKEREREREREGVREREREGVRERERESVPRVRVLEFCR